MKTLKELNSKWYWRLFKVLYLGILSIIVISIGAVSSEMFYQYHPNDIEFVKKELDGQYDTSIVRQERIDKLLGHYSSGNLNTIASNKGAQIAYIMQILIKDAGADIEGVYGFCEDSDFRCFPYFSPENGPYESYLKDGIEIGISKNELNSFRTFLENIEAYNKSKTGYSEYEYFETYKEIINQNYYIPYKNYLGFLGIIKSICIGLLSLISAVLITIIFRFILYYIIFGKFNPEE